MEDYTFRKQFLFQIKAVKLVLVDVYNQIFFLFHIRVVFEVKLDTLSHTRMHTLFTWGQVCLSVSPSQQNSTKLNSTKYNQFEPPLPVSGDIIQDMYRSFLVWRRSDAKLSNGQNVQIRFYSVFILCFWLTEGFNIYFFDMPTSWNNSLVMLMSKKLPADTSGTHCDVKSPSLLYRRDGSIIQ